MLLHRFATLSFSCLLACVLASSADARERRNARAHAPKSGHVERTVTRTGPNGVPRTSTHESSWQRGDGQWSRESVHTGPKGGVTTRNATGSYDPASKTWTKNATTTRPNGSTTSSQVIRQVTPITDPAGSAQ